MTPWRCCAVPLLWLAACAGQPRRVEVLPEPPAYAAPAPAASEPTGYRQAGHLAANAPADRPAVGYSADPDPDVALANWRKAIAPSVAQALATYPASKKRYLAGLPQGENFFVTVVLRDRTRRFEEVFVLVDRIEGGTITGRLASDIYGIEGHESGETLQVPESEVIDWTISTADGHEEGNFVGKYLDSVQDGGSP